MTDSTEGAGNPSDPVGTVGEEAAKLFAALSGFARSQSSDYADTAAGAASSFAEAISGINDHIASGGEDCRYCPVCQVIHAVRQTSPEVRAHLAVAASSLIQAAAGVLATRTPGQNPGGPMERIDLDDTADWDDES